MKSFLLQSVLIIAAMIAFTGNNSNAQWVRMKGPYGWEFNQFTAGNSIILAGGPSHGIYRSTDNGLHWLEANSGITNTDITSLGLYKQNFLAGVWDGTNTLLYLSTDNANSWAQVNTISPKQLITSFAVKDSIIFLGTYGDGIYSSTDGGFHWKRPANLSLEHPVVSLLVNEKNLYAGTWGGAVYKSTDNGENWTQLTIPNYNRYVTSLFINNNKLFMQSGRSLYASSDNGQSWSTANSTLPFSNIGTIITTAAGLFLGGDNGVYFSKDEGISWTAAGLPGAIVEAMTFYGGNLIAGTRDIGLFTSTDSGTNWLQTGALNNTMVQALAVIDSNLFAGNNAQEGVFISRDNGNTYREYDNLSHSFVLCMTTRGSDILAGTEMHLTGGGGIFKSTDLGKNWSLLGLKNIGVISVNYRQSFIFAGTDNGVYITSNEGALWSHVNNGLPATRVNALELIDTILFAGTNSGVYKSTDNGTNWTLFGLKDTAITSLLKSGSSLLAGTAFGLFTTTPASTKWMRAAFADTVISFLKTNNTSIFAGTSKGVFFSNNGGKIWTNINDGFDKSSITSFEVNNSYMFAGSWGEGIYRRSLSDLLTGISQEKYLPANFVLAQNYPNPFNPTTTISYTVSQPGFVSIIVYDILGKEIATLVNEEKGAGNYKVSFDAANLSSGIYIYKMKSGSFEGIRKFVLMK